MSPRPQQNPWLDPERTMAGSPAAKYLSSLGKGSRRTVQESLARLAAMLTGIEKVDPFKVRWERLRREQTVKLRAELMEQLAPATANKVLSVLRGVLRTCRDMGLLGEGEFQTAASLERVKPKPPAEAVPVSEAVLRVMFKACLDDRTASGRRDAALLALFASTGLRRAEAVALDVGDYDPRSGQLHIRGERPEYDRLAVLGKPARQAMADWLEVRSREPGPLLLPVDRGGLIRFRRMTDQAMYDIGGRIAARAGVPNVTLRDIRRAYVMSLIRAGKELAEVQYLAGHASWLTTASYQQLGAEKKHPTYNVANLPYQPRSTP
ncbi:MAG TPA: site-specific integrase [Phycisphaerales bacterium]|nr:site-specific integrase [Phycisphaerales bacterium]